MSSPVVELSPVLPEQPPVLSRALTAPQIERVVSEIQSAVQGKSVAQVLAALPGVVESTYTLVQSFLSADQETISNAVLALVTKGVDLSGLSQEDIVVVDEVLTSLVPSLIKLVAKWAPEVEAEVEHCCSGFWAWLKKIFKC